MKTIKTSIKEPGKTIKNQKKIDQLKSLLLLEKKLDLKDQIASHKKIDKGVKKKNKKLKVTRLN